eukprot:TRINITY_DN2855_c1_g2_i1.p1 TRINITY_DN2855_c1_g2~~TRINITY_DN2855_c1_g2_i1.p1  ORF type:complete len:378 (+),score=51.75 TRINITY_DN2855_c1_g2_i1:135-1268(+)
MLQGRLIKLTRARHLHSKYENGSRLLWKKGSVVGDAHSGVRSRTKSPGTKSGKMARTQVSTCKDFKTLWEIATSTEHSDDMTVVGCVLQRLGELAGPRNNASKTLTTYLNNHADDILWTPVLSSIVLTSLARCHVPLHTVKATWRKIPKEIRCLPTCVGSAMKSARHDVTWADELWRTNPCHAAKPGYLLSLAENRSWSLVREIGYATEAIAGLLCISRRQDLPVEGWALWKWVHDNNVKTSCADVTALLEFLISFGTQKEMVWGLKVSGASPVTDARLLLQQSCVAAYLYAVTSSQRWHDVFNTYVAGFKHLPEHLKCISWEADKLQDLRMKVAAIVYLKTEEQKKSYHRVICRCIGRAEEGETQHTIERLERILK